MRVVLLVLVLVLVLVGASAEAQNICDPDWLETASRLSTSQPTVRAGAC